jgi:hypothetical protein
MPRCRRSHSWNSATRRSSTGAALAEELDEPADPPHVLAGDVLLGPATRTLATMLREAIDDGLVDVGDRDLGLQQPMREVASCIIVALQARVPSCRRRRVNSATQGASSPASMRCRPAQLSSFVLAIRCFPLVAMTEGRVELCGAGKPAHSTKLLKTSLVSGRRKADSA